MTIRTPTWLQAGSYPAETDRLLLKSLLGGSPNAAAASGIVTLGDLAVTASATPDMNVHIAPGAAFIAGTETTTQGVYGFYSDASVTVLLAASSSQPRISLIVAEVLDAGYSGSSNIGQIVEVAGTPGASPVAPATPKNAIVLAQIAVAASASSISQSAITDSRKIGGVGGGILRASSSAQYPANPVAGQYVDDAALGALVRWSGTAWQQLGKLAQQTQHGTGTLSFSASAQSAATAFNFATPFPAGVTPDLAITPGAFTGNTPAGISYTGISNTGFTVMARLISGASVTGSISFSYVAVGG